MSTISFGLSTAETTKRFRTSLLSAAGVITDVDNVSVVKKTLARSSSFTINPKKLLAISSNAVNLLIRITVNANTITLPMSSWLCLPFNPTDTVSVVVENPANNDVELDAVVSYLIV